MLNLSKLTRISLVPREKKFFALFEQSAQNAVTTAQQLKDLVCVWDNVKERVQVIDDLEHQGDAINHQVMALLRNTFITPFDREDIALLANSLDDVTDFINSASDAMFLYNVEAPTARAKELADILVEAVAEVERAIIGIRDRIDRDTLLRQCVEINRIENTGDHVYRAATAELFADSTNVANLIKWREIYQHMESAIDSCEDVAKALEGIALKYT